MNKNSTKRALLLSALALTMCVAMLIGSTFAWFTDSASTAVNTIQAGTLKIDITSDAQGTQSLEGQSLKFVAKDGNTNVLWEPNCTFDTQEFYIANKGDLALKFQFDITGAQGDVKLLKVIDFTAMAEAQWFDFDMGIASITPPAGVKFDMLSGYVMGADSYNEYILTPGEVVGPIKISGHMDKDAGNEYQGLTVTGLAISIVATQACYENDSIDASYDSLAAYAGEGYGVIEEDGSGANIPIRNDDGSKTGAFEVPADAFADPTKPVKGEMKESDYEPNITIDTGSEAVTIDISMEGIKENNDVPIKVMYRLPTGLDPNYVKIYHYDTLIDSKYDPYTGYVTFYSTTFSPFTFVADPDKKYDPSVVDPDGFPRANVVNEPQYENCELPWGSYGPWSPTEGLDSQLEAAYTFSCKESLEQAKANPYAYWYCDFFVKLDKDLGANEIFLGGNYGSFGWVGFHNGELTLDANTEIPLLGSVTSNPWTYLDVVQNVKSFICGVGDVDNALAGSTFTVTLRLTNPENAEDFKDIATINYKFTND